MLIQRAPEHLSLFQKKESRWSKLFNFYEFFIRTVYLGIFGWLASKIANYAFYYAHGGAWIGMLLAVACLLGATYNGAIAGKLACRMAGM
jgi:hypothetical protein